MKKYFCLCVLTLLFGVVAVWPAAAEQALSEQDKKIRNENCVNLCGEGYYYDRPGAKNNGRELVCTKYPLPCGYKCTVGWNFRYLVDGTNYTCQEARQVSEY